MDRFLLIKSFRHILAGAIALVLVGVASPASAVVVETINLRSGVDANFDGRDDNVTFFEGPRDGPFAGPITGAQLSGASAGSQAYLVNPLFPQWAPNLAADPLARWIGKGYTAENPNNGAAGGSDGVTAIFAIDFTITSPIFSEVLLDLAYLIDDSLGDIDDLGLYINGTALAGSVDLGAGNYLSQQVFPTFDITDLVTTGLNTLYFYVNDSGGGASGINFSAQIGVVDEPVTIGALGLGLLAMGAVRRRRRT